VNFSYSLFSSFSFRPSAREGFAVVVNEFFLRPIRLFDGLETAVDDKATTMAGGVGGTHRHQTTDRILPIWKSSSFCPVGGT
jgi:hypothetical protein